MTTTTADLKGLAAQIRKRMSTREIGDRDAVESLLAAIDALPDGDELAALRAERDQLKAALDKATAERPVIEANAREAGYKRFEADLAAARSEAGALREALKRRACRRCQHLLHTSEQNSMCLATDKDGEPFCGCKEDHRHDERARTALASPSASAEWLRGQLDAARAEAETRLTVLRKAMGVHDSANTSIADDIAKHDERVRAAALEESARFIEGGSFLHDKAPTKLFANEVAPKIRALARAPAAKPSERRLTPAEMDEAAGYPLDHALMEKVRRGGLASLKPSEPTCVRCGGEGRIQVGTGQPSGEGGEAWDEAPCPDCGGPRL